MAGSPDRRRTTEGEGDDEGDGEEGAGQAQGEEADHGPLQAVIASAAKQSRGDVSARGPLDCFATQRWLAMTEIHPTPRMRSMKKEGVGRQGKSRRWR